MNINRVRQLNSFCIAKGPIFYWLSREQRINNNWALNYAYDLAVRHSSQFGIFFYLFDHFLGAPEKFYRFMLDNLLQMKNDLLKINIPFILLKGNPIDTITNFCKKNNVSAIVTDFDPLKIKRDLKSKLVARLNIPIFEVDAHNIVPCWITSTKQEFSARTIRQKIKKLLPEYLDDFPEIKYYPLNNSEFFVNLRGFDNFYLFEDKDLTIPFWKSGEKEAKRILEEFINNKINYYNKYRNNPNKDFCSNLSPYLHFGQISSQQVVLSVMKKGVPYELTDSFFDEIIIRKELSDNYCYYNHNYDNFEGFPNWAKETLDKHRNDKRNYIYSLEEFENAKTHDPLWNSAQKQMMITGKMHGYLRMYWAKKILEWSKSPEEAQKIAIYLNDKYEIDGRDPNGYTGIAWSIGGLHDRPWKEREIFGKIRYMSFRGMESKFNVNDYINSIHKIEKEYL